MKASRRKTNRAVDVDVQLSKDGTMWALHWGSVGKNKLHDPSGKIKSADRISHLTDEQIATLRGPNGQHPHTIQRMMNLAAAVKVRLELELKVFVPIYTIMDRLKTTSGEFLQKHDLIQFKVRAALNDSVGIITQAHNAGGTTIMSWESYEGPGIPKHPAWVVVDYSRGRAHWI